MEEPAELRSEVAPSKLVIGYAEPSTRPRRSFLQWLAGNWLFVFVKIVLLVALSFIGGTVGSTYFDLSPAKPWEGVVEVTDPQQGSSTENMRELQHDHDLLEATGSPAFLVNRFGYAVPFPDASQRSSDVHVSAVGRDGSFSVTVNCTDFQRCYSSVDAYFDALSAAINSQNQHLPLRCISAHKTIRAECAPAMDTAAGILPGLLIGIVIIRISAVGFRKASTPKV